MQLVSIISTSYNHIRYRAELVHMRASLKYLKTYNVPQSRGPIIEDFEKICKELRVSQSSVIVTLIAAYVKENRKILAKAKQEELEAI